MTGSELAALLRSLASRLERFGEVELLRFELAPGVVLDVRPPAASRLRQSEPSGYRARFAGAFDPIRCDACGLAIGHLDFGILAWRELPGDKGVVRVAKVTHKGTCDPGLNRWQELSDITASELARIVIGYDFSEHLAERLTQDVFFERFCSYCGVLTDPSDRMSPRAPQVDHVKPLSQGGSHDDENLRLSCRHCNASKGGRTPTEAGMVVK